LKTTRVIPEFRCYNDTLTAQKTNRKQKDLLDCETVRDRIYEATYKLYPKFPYLEVKSALFYAASKQDPSEGMVYSIFPEDFQDRAGKLRIKKTKLPVILQGLGKLKMKSFKRKVEGLPEGKKKARLEKNKRSHATVRRIDHSEVPTLKEGWSYHVDEISKLIPFQMTYL
jgi:hypothetical protein